MKIQELCVTNTLWDDYHKVPINISVEDLVNISESLNNNQRPRYSAIALSHERLLSMGFRFANEFYDQGYIVLQLQGGRCTTMYNYEHEYGRPMFYVHDLQNRIYSLTNEQLLFNQL